MSVPLPVAAPARRLLVVSIHDVAPSTAGEVEWLRDRLDELGVGRRVLKVIPFEHGERHVDEDEALVAALRAEEAGGGEVVLHGWTHRTDDPPPVVAHAGSLVDRARARLFAGPAAEFLGLPAAEAARRIKAGVASLTGLGLRVDGFCPPGWLAGPDAMAALRSSGLRYVATYASLIELASGRRTFLPGFGSMGTDDIQEALAAAEGGYVLLAAAWLPVIRVFLHPAGAPRSRACARALRGIARLRRDRDAVTFRDVLDRAAAADSAQGRAA